MTTVINSQPVTGSYKVDPNRGGHNGTVSAQWFSRPADQKFLSMVDMANHFGARRENSTISDQMSAKIRVQAHRDNPTQLLFMLEDGQPVETTNWSFGQICRQVKAPADYLQRLPAFVTAMNLQVGLMSHDEELIKTLVLNEDGTPYPVLRAVTSPTYGRIWDSDIIQSVIKITDSGPWKIPGQIDWSTHQYDPFTPVTLESSTLYGSDRDFFAFLVDDTHPIEVGKLQNGDPDLMFRGFYAWNSEVGSKTAGFASMYLRAVCMNRNLWGVEHFQEIKIRHNRLAPERLASMALPALETFTNADPTSLINGVKAAQAAVVAKDDESRMDFLTEKVEMSRRLAKEALSQFLEDEGHPADSIWDMAQAITAAAKKVDHTDERVKLELKGKAILDKVARAR